MATNVAITIQPTISNLKLVRITYPVNHDSADNATRAERLQSCGNKDCATLSPHPSRNIALYDRIDGLSSGTCPHKFMSHAERLSAVRLDEQCLANLQARHFQRD